MYSKLTFLTLESHELSCYFLLKTDLEKNFKALMIKKVKSTVQQPLIGCAHPENNTVHTGSRVSQFIANLVIICYAWHRHDATPQDSLPQGK
jgi:hypothetical protein